MGLKPDFRIRADGGDITQIIAERLISLRLTDEAGIESDMLELVLSDHTPAIDLPATGAELDLSLGYDGRLDRMGLFVVDEIELDGWPSTMTIRARGAVYAASSGGKVDLQSQKTRSWSEGTTLDAMIRKIAGEHGLRAVISQSLATVELPHTDQTRESDLHLLQRLAQRYDAALKAAGGSLVLTKRGEGKSASGSDLPAVSLSPLDCTAYRATLARRDAPGTVKAFWQDTNAARREEALFGDGDPVRELRQIFPTQAAAEEAARAEHGRRARGEAQVSLTLPGRTDLQAEAPLVTRGFRPGVDGQWTITRVEHSLDASGGYSTTVEAETKPAAD